MTQARDNTDSPIDYEMLRRLVIAAFGDADAPSHQSPLADWQTSRTRPRKLYRQTNLYPEHPENTKATGTETRRPGRSDIPMGHKDSGASRILIAIRKLPPVDQAVLGYCYDANSIGAKPFVKNLIWREYLPELHNRNAQTKGIAVMMLDAALPCYRDWTIKRLDYPARPWLMFSEITPPMWRRTYRKIWHGLLETMESVDHAILVRLRSLDAR